MGTVRAQYERICAHTALALRSYCAPTVLQFGAHYKLSMDAVWTHLGAKWMQRGALGSQCRRKRANIFFTFIYFGEFSKIMSALGAYGTFSAIVAHALALVRPHCAISAV